jgi:hypothetical protein
LPRAERQGEREREPSDEREREREPSDEREREREPSDERERQPRGCCRIVGSRSSDHRIVIIGSRSSSEN